MRVEPTSREQPNLVENDPSRSLPNCISVAKLRKLAAADT
jgi:hypothetical protein